MPASNLLPPEAVEEFKKLYEVRFKQKISDEEASRRANNFLGLFQAVYGFSGNK